ncbi:MAG: hypothetical protein QM589_14055 [Thermomicrobiales bacterium]
MERNSGAVTYLLMPSPLLGGSVWEPVAEALRASGHDAFIVPPMRTVPSSPADVIGHLLDVVPANGCFVLVPHSNAGLFVPALIAVRSVATTVFVDARLPPASGQVVGAEGEFLHVLAGMADGDGTLPPWTRWWSEEDLEALYPTVEARQRVEREAPRLPLSYFRAAVAVPPGWDHAGGAYLAFCETYRAERDGAARRGWPTATIPGGHLHMLHDPTGVAGWIVRLSAEAMRLGSAAQLQ